MTAHPNQPPSNDPPRKRAPRGSFDKTAYARDYMRRRRAAESVNSCIYVVGADPRGPVKIGVTGGLNRRLSQLQMGNPIRLQILWSIEVSTAEARSSEQSVHKILNADRMTGEWFNVSIEAATRAILLVVDPDAITPEATADPDIFFSAGNMVMTMGSHEMGIFRLAAARSGLSLSAWVRMALREAAERRLEPIGERPEWAG